MMIRYATICFTLASLLQLSALGQTSTVNYSGAGAGQRNVVDSSGTPLADGNLATIGYFTPGFDVNANANDYTALQGAWHLYGETTIQTILGRHGSFAGVSSQSDTSFTGKPIYLWITDTNLAGSVTEYGVFTSTLGNWVFPDPNALSPGNSQSVDTSQVDGFAFGGQVAGTPGSLQLANVVPEPSTFSLLAVGLVVGRFWLRRR